MTYPVLAQGEGALQAVGNAELVARAGASREDESTSGGY